MDLVAILVREDSCNSEEYQQIGRKRKLENSLGELIQTIVQTHVHSQVKVHECKQYRPPIARTACEEIHPEIHDAGINDDSMSGSL